MTTAEPETEARGRIMERPDGFYWQDREDDMLYGPFPTRLAAEQDMQYEADNDFAEGETLEEAEDEIGIAGWADTGEPAEESLPHFHIE